MTPRTPPPALSRRHALGGLLGGSVAVLAGCSTSRPRDAEPDPTTTPDPTTAVDRLAALEESTGRTIGAVLLEGERQLVAHRPDDVLPTCSIFKTFLVATLLHDRGDDRGYWTDTEIDYDADDLVVNSAVLSERSGPITPHELGEAVLRYSDNTAANLLLAEVGGPGAVTDFVRSLGAETTRFDRTEPGLNAAVPGDERDTSTPAEVAMLMHALLVDRRAGAYTASRLSTWMLWNETSRIGEALSPGDELADRTGAGAYGVVNDAGVLFRPDQPPRALAIMTRTDDEDAENDDTVVLEAARILLAA